MSRNPNTLTDEDRSARRAVAMTNEGRRSPLPGLPGFTTTVHRPRKLTYAHSRPRKDGRYTTHVVRLTIVVEHNHHRWLYIRYLCGAESWNGQQVDNADTNPCTMCLLRAGVRTVAVPEEPEPESVMTDIAKVDPWQPVAARMSRRIMRVEKLLDAWEKDSRYAIPTSIIVRSIRNALK